ncbi:hypothetical protein [Ornithinimicrobium pekingense]|uniref:Uncharacterized protein n=1 Tax=Ornithinimicrobium pekingense TaxID=384677 RepID=A0ABQ2F6B9_9MICO|nr:hypothetical protein [Ornithinimicrobium pekingense]GGK65054.1 hypothetical protein GCM10011509_11720 [Ornithinimicrobium pekingense]
MTGGSSAYLDAPTLALLVGGLGLALVCLVSGLNGRAPGRLTVGLTALLQLGVLAYAAWYLVRQLSGQAPAGPTWELWSYLVTILLLPALALVWAREERTRWSTFVLAVAAFVVAVMGARCAQIWHGVGLMTP